MAHLCYFKVVIHEFVYALSLCGTLGATVERPLEASLNDAYVAHCSPELLAIRSYLRYHYSNIFSIISTFGFCERNLIGALDGLLSRSSVAALEDCLLAPLGKNAPRFASQYDILSSK